MFSNSSKFLIVDDMPTMRKLAITALKSMGYSVFIEAEDGIKAWEKLQEHPDINIIISDLNMPNCNGLDFLKKVRAQDASKKTAFIMLTAEGEAKYVSEAIINGVDNYCLKPFTAVMLKEKLEATFKRKSAA